MDALLLQQTGLGVGTVQHRLILITPAGIPNASDNSRRLFLGTFIFLKADLQALLLCGPKLLLLSVLIFRNDHIGQVQNRSGGAIVLFQLYHLAVWKMRFKGKDVFHIGSPETVYTLVIVSHHADILILLGKEINQMELHIIGILILVH